MSKKLAKSGKALVKINPREFQRSFFNSVLVFKKLKQLFLTYLPCFLLSSNLPTERRGRRAKPQSYYINRIRMSVCLSVRSLSPPWVFDQESRQYTRRVGISCHSKGKLLQFSFDQLSGRYCPETGHWQKKSGQKWPIFRGFWNI